MAAVRGVSFDVRAREVFALAGESGAARHAAEGCEATGMAHPGLQDELGLGCLAICHDRAVVRHFADRVPETRDGRISSG